MKNGHRMGDEFGARVRKAAPGLNEGVGVKGRWGIVCRDKHGNVKWTDVIVNLVTNAGLDYLLDVGLSGGSPITTWYVGLTGASPTVNAADTLGSHAGWTEVTDYTGNRQAWTDGGVANQSVSNGGNAAQFEIDADNTTIGGAFLASAAAGTSGTLYAVGAFSAGNKTLDEGDVLTVTATFTAAAA